GGVWVAAVVAVAARVRLVRSEIGHELRRLVARRRRRVLYIVRIRPALDAAGPADAHAVQQGEATDAFAEQALVAGRPGMVRGVRQPARGGRPGDVLGRGEA